MFRHHIYPVPHLLLQKSTLYPSFLPSFVFFPLPDMLLLYVCCCLASSLLSICFALLCFDAFHFHLFLLHFTYIMTGAFILAVVLVFYCFLSGHSCFLSASLSCILSIPLFFSLCLILYLSHFSTLFYMFCR